LSYSAGCVTGSNLGLGLGVNPGVEQVCFGCPIELARSAIAAGPDSENGGVFTSETGVTMLEARLHIHIHIFIVNRPRNGRG